MSPTQLAILEALQNAAQKAGLSSFALVSEYLGYLPFGVYMWVEIGNDSNVDREFPSGWNREDIEALVHHGHALHVRRQVFDAQGFDSREDYELLSLARGPSDDEEG
jgi:hypothetical protein